MAIPYSLTPKSMRRRAVKRVSFRDIKSKGKQPLADVFWVESKKKASVPTASLECYCNIF